MSPLLSTFFGNRAGELPPLDTLNWESLIKIAEQEAVLPALHGRVQELGLSAQLPAEVSTFLSAVEQLNLERNQVILADVETVAGLLNQVGIEPVLLKGAAYCVAGVYPNPAVRYLLDVDLLIPESQLSSAVEILLQNGFEHEPNVPLGRFRHHYPPLRKQGVSIELHHALGIGISKSLLPASEVLERSLPHALNGTRVRLPSPTHLATHLIMHSQISHPYNERIWPPLRAMYDLVLLRRRYGAEIDWRAVENYFASAGQSAVLKMHLLQVQDILGEPTPFPIHLTGLARLRWLRRKLLRALPGLRFIDPIYMYSTVMVRRVRLLQSALSEPGGWKHILRELFAPDFYKRFFTDILEGRGR